MYCDSGALPWIPFASPVMCDGFRDLRKPSELPLTSCTSFDVGYGSIFCNGNYQLHITSVPSSSGIWNVFICGREKVFWRSFNSSTSIINLCSLFWWQPYRNNIKKYHIHLFSEKVKWRICKVYLILLLISFKLKN